MSEVNNLEYLYSHLPARYRREDAKPEQNYILKRFLTPIAQEMDGFDEKYETFHLTIDPATAPQNYIEWWLYSLFGWGWFPTWFTIEQRRAFYSEIASHYARRGTIQGIHDFLAAFGVQTIIEAEPQFWGEGTWGEESFSITGPLGILVRLLPEADAVPEELSFYGEGTWGEDTWAAPALSLQHADVDELLRFCWPLAHIIFIEDVPLSSGSEQGAPFGNVPDYGSPDYGELEGEFA